MDEIPGGLSFLHSLAGEVSGRNNITPHTQGGRNLLGMFYHNGKSLRKSSFLATPPLPP